jgi:hypothetical protein
MVTLKNYIAIATGTASLVSLLLASGIEVSVNEGSSLLQWGTSAAAAENFITYEPPDRGAPRSTQGTGTRGCTLPNSDRSVTPTSLTLLVPNDHTGQTISANPTFAWYVPATTSVPIEFSLVAPNVVDPLYVTTVEPDDNGIVRVTLPEDVASLETGKTYRWSVTVVCNPNRRSSDIFAQSWIKRVAPSNEAIAQLDNAQSDLEAARIYAQSGYWYDALATLLEPETTSASDPAIQQARTALFEQAGVKPTEQPLVNR